MTQQAKGARRAAGALLTTVSLLLVLASGGGPASARTGDAQRTQGLPALPAPNIVLILTDDQRADTMRFMPKTRRLIAEPGVNFTNAFVPTPICCPSRASTLTGDYSHTTGVWTNGMGNTNAEYGGFPAFDDATTLATLLHAQGYQTALVGKYLNRYDEGADHGYIPPGWDSWHAFAGVNGEYYNYDLIDSGGRGGYRMEHFGHRPEDYSTDVLADRAVTTIARTQSPFFLYFAPFASHGSYRYSKRDADRIADMHPPEPNPSFAEGDVGDKPRFIRSLPEPTKGWRTQQRRLFDDAVKTLPAVDRAVEQIVTQVEAEGELDNTIFVFTSDNGRSFGEHRWSFKDTPWDESVHVPMFVRYDAFQQQAGSPDEISDLVLNVDFAPTMLELAGASASPMDGESWGLLFAGEHPAWRGDFPLEHLLTVDGQHDVPTYCGVRSQDSLYVAWGPNQEEELYDLTVDPFQEASVARSPAYAGDLSQMRARAAALCDPLPPDPTFAIPAP